MLDELGVVGVSWRQGGSEALAEFALPPEDRDARLREFRERVELEELAYLETCNRVELLFAQRPGADIRDLRPEVTRFLLGRELPPGEAERRLRAWKGEGASEHLLLVTAGLDSAALGEAEIAGQVRACRDHAMRLGLLGPRLGVLFEEALRTAGHIRDETGIGQGRVSLAEIAMSRIGKDPQAAAGPVALVGVSVMTRRVAQSLAKRRIPLVVVNRTGEKAHSLAASCGGRGQSLKAFLDHPPAVTAVLAATGARKPVLGEAGLARLAAASPREQGPLLIDMAVPADICPVASARLGLERVDMNDIAEEAQQAQQARASEVATARSLVDEALPRVEERLVGRAYGSIYGVLQERYRNIACEGVDRLLRKELRRLGPAERESLSKWAESLARRLAHIPTQGLRGLLHHGPDGSFDAFVDGAGFDWETGRRPGHNRAASESGQTEPA